MRSAFAHPLGLTESGSSLESPSRVIQSRQRSARQEQSQRLMHDIRYTIGRMWGFG